MNKIWISLGSAIAVAAPVSAVTAYLMLRNKNTTTTTNTTNTAPAESSIKYLEDTPIKTLDGYTIESQEDGWIYVQVFNKDQPDLDAKKGIFALKEKDLQKGQTIKVDSMTPGKQTELKIITSIEAKDIDAPKKDFSSNIEATGFDWSHNKKTQTLMNFDANFDATISDKKNYLIKKDNKIMGLINSADDYKKILKYIFQEDKNVHTYTVEKIKNVVDELLKVVNKVATDVDFEDVDSIIFEIEDKK